MPLRLAEGHALALPSFRRAIHKLREGLPRPGAAGLAGVAAAEIALSLPHPVYDLTREDLAEGRGLSAARQTGWRCLVSRGDGSVAAVEAPLGPPPLPPRPGGPPVPPSAPAEPAESHVNTGPFVAATEVALKLAEAHPEVLLHPFELRLLRITALHVMALWLVPDGGGPGLVVPLAPRPRDLAEGVLAEKDFVSSLSAAARAQRERPGSPWR